MVKGQLLYCRKTKRWVSFSQSDADGNVGASPMRSSSQASAWGDAFALFVRWEHGGSFRRALRIAAPNRR